LGRKHRSEGRTGVKKVGRLDFAYVTLLKKKVLKRREKRKKTGGAVVYFYPSSATKTKRWGLHSCNTPKGSFIQTYKKTEVVHLSHRERTEK